MVLLATYCEHNTKMDKTRNYAQSVNYIRYFLASWNESRMMKMLNRLRAMYRSSSMTCETNDAHFRLFEWRLLSYKCKYNIDTDFITAPQAHKRILLTNTSRCDASAKIIMLEQ